MTEKFGQRLLPNILHHEADKNPNRIFAIFAKSGVDDLAEALTEVNFGQIARAVNHVANWLQSTFEKGDKPQRHDTLAYIGVPDLRYNILFYAATQCQYKIFLPSPRNPTAINRALFGQLECTKLVYVEEVTSIARALEASAPSLPIRLAKLPSLDELLLVRESRFTYNVRFSDVSDDPVLVLHSSGSTGLPKPVTSTHGTLATSDVRDYQAVPGHTNHDGVNSFRFPNDRIFDVFPPFHLAGFMLKIVIPLFNLTAPIFAPCSRPPSGNLAAEIIRLQRPRGVCLPPSIIEQLYHEPDGKHLLKRLDILGFAGGPLASSIGGEISRNTRLFQFYGSTEAGQMRQVTPLPEDWEYLQFHPIERFEFQPEGDGTFELVLHPHKNIKRTSHLHNNYPDIREWRTKDLFTRNPTKPDLWKFHARKDDILVFSNGEKLNPIPIESYLSTIDGVTGALVVGSRRPCAAILIELNQSLRQSISAHPLESFWTEVEEANSLAPSHGRIAKSMILFAATDKPFRRAGKGTVIRRLTEELYSEEIDHLYASEGPLRMRRAVAPLPLKPSIFSLEDIKEMIRTVLTMASVPDRVGDERNLFASGLDSLKTVEVVAQLRTSLEPLVQSLDDLKWLTLEFVFRNPSIEQLSSALSGFLNHRIIPRRTNRRAEIESTVTRYIDGLHHGIIRAQDGNTPHRERYSVVITGTTGYLGMFLLQEFLRDPKISHIYALNRSTTAAKLFEEQYGHYNRSIVNLEFIHVNLSQSRLGLSTEEYARVQCCDAIIHNAWSVDFNLPLASFDDNLKSVRNLIDVSSGSLNRSQPRIYFVSSIAATGVWAPRSSSRRVIPASVLNEPGDIMETGYGESKYVAEQILRVAAEESVIPVTILRTGQIYPSSDPEAHDTWPVTDLLGISLLACRALGALPFDLLETMDGIPVNWVASVFHDIVNKQSFNPGQAMHVYNVVHPNPTPWSDVLGSVQTWCGNFDKALLLNTQQWTHRLTESNASTPQQRSALRMLALYELLSQRGPMHEYETGNMSDMSESVSKMPKVDNQLMEM